MIKVLHCLPNFDRGGMGNYLLEIIQRYDRSKYQMDVCVLGECSGELAKEAEDSGSKVYVCSGVYSGLFTFIIKFRRIIKKEDYDVVIIHRGYASATALIIAAFTGVKVRICHPHSLRDVIEKTNSLTMKIVINIQKRLTIRFATGYIGISAYILRELFGSAITEKNSRIIPCGVNLNNYEDNVTEGLAVRKRLRIDNTTKVVGHVGLFLEHKNHHLFIEIAEHVVRKDENVVFLLVGSGGPLAESVQKRINSSLVRDKFILAGWQDNIPAYMSVMDLMLFPSKWEGFPIAVIEANASGLPVVVSDLPLFDEALSPEAQWCRIPLDNPQKAAELVCEILVSEEIHNKLSIAAKEYARDFSIENSIDKLERYLSGLVNKN